MEIQAINRNLFDNSVNPWEEFVALFRGMGTSGVEGLDADLQAKLKSGDKAGALADLEKLQEMIGKLQDDAKGMKTPLIGALKDDLDSLSTAYSKIRQDVESGDFSDALGLEGSTIANLLGGIEQIVL